MVLQWSEGQSDMSKVTTDKQNKVIEDTHAGYHVHIEAKLIKLMMYGWYVNFEGYNLKFHTMTLMALCIL